MGSGSALAMALAVCWTRVTTGSVLPLPTAPQLAWQKNEIMALSKFASPLQMLHAAAYARCRATQRVWYPAAERRTRSPQLSFVCRLCTIVHFNMATFFENGDPGCTAANWAGSQKPGSFAPSRLNVSNWIVSMRDLGVKEAVLTAK